MRPPCCSMACATAWAPGTFLAAVIEHVLDVALWADSAADGVILVGEELVFWHVFRLEVGQKLRFGALVPVADEFFRLYLLKGVSGSFGRFLFW